MPKLKGPESSTIKSVPKALPPNEETEIIRSPNRVTGRPEMRVRKRLMGRKTTR